MAVYTQVADDELAAFLGAYDIGALVSYKGIAEGVENSNYFLQTERGSFILTLYEKRVDPADLPFFLGLMDHLAAQGIVCPTPIHARDGAALRTLAGRPAAIVSYLQGVSPRRVDIRHCAPLGRALAEMHLAAAAFGAARPNALDLAGWRPLFEPLRPARPRGAERPGRRDRAGAGVPGTELAVRACRPASSMPTCFPTMFSSWTTGSRA